MITLPKEYFRDTQTKVTLTLLRNPQYSSEDLSTIDCELVIKEIGLEVLPFTASKFDVDVVGREIYNDILSGVFGDISPYKL